MARSECSHGSSRSVAVPPHDVSKSHASRMRGAVELDVDIRIEMHNGMKPGEAVTLARRGVECVRRCISVRGGITAPRAS